jgi:hypothetical protein
MADHPRKSPLSVNKKNTATPARTRTQTARVVAETSRPAPSSEYVRSEAYRADFFDMDYMGQLLADLRKDAQRK